jgi:hypothetical protein
MLKPKKSRISKDINNVLSEAVNKAYRNIFNQVCSGALFGCPFPTSKLLKVCYKSDTILLSSLHELYMAMLMHVDAMFLIC